MKFLIPNPVRLLFSLLICHFHYKKRIFTDLVASKHFDKVNDVEYSQCFQCFERLMFNGLIYEAATDF